MHHFNLNPVVLLAAAAAFGQKAVAEDSDGLDSPGRAFVRCAFAATGEGRISKYRVFVSQHPQSDLADDALLAILKEHLDADEVDEARACLTRLRDQHPDGVMRRNIYIGDTDDEWLGDFKQFARQNPIGTSQWGELLLARRLLDRGDVQEGALFARRLLEETAKPTIPDNASPAIFHTEDIRGATLQLCAIIARRGGDGELAQRVRALAVTNRFH